MAARDAEHRAFMEHIEPTVQKWARKSFRRDDDAVAECVGLAWKWSARLWEKGREPLCFPCKIAQYAVRAVRSGRKVAGKNSRDVMEPNAQRKHSFIVQTLPVHDTFADDDNPCLEAMTDHSNALPSDHAAFRVDWPAFLAQRPDREKLMAEMLGVGEQAVTAARALGVSPGRLTQIRQRMRDDWNRATE